MKHSKEHIQAVEERMQEYDERLVPGAEYRVLDRCRVCDTVADDTSAKYRGLHNCELCLFGGMEYPKNTAPCLGPHGHHGAMCGTPNDMQIQFRHLKNQLKKNGYEFK